jgi:hypothetical protein
VLRRIASRWARRAVVKGDELDYAALFHDELPDFPLRMLPFAAHPDFLAAAPEMRSLALTWGWIMYNERTIAAEDHIANPAFVNIMRERFPGSEHPLIKQTIGQALVDEHYHTLMHVMATALCKRRRQLAPLKLPESVTLRALRAAQAAAGDSWHRDLIQLCFAITSEVSINAYLSLLSQDDTIQPLHRTLTDMHNRDEFGHMILLVEVARVIYGAMTAAEKELFLRSLPFALEAYVAADFTTWKVILRHLGFAKAEAIVEDSRTAPGGTSLTRDYSGIKLLTDTLGITGQVDFDFARASQKHAPLWKKLNL